MHMVHYRWPQIDIVDDERPIRVSVHYSWDWTKREIEAAIERGIARFNRLLEG